jgi:hypothetical protein
VPNGHPTLKLALELACGERRRIHARETPVTTAILGRAGNEKEMANRYRSK